MIDLAGRAALVTGGSRGIGRATALRLAEAGADVIVNYVSSRSPALEVARRIEAIGERGEGVPEIGMEPGRLQLVEVRAGETGRCEFVAVIAATLRGRVVDDEEQRFTVQFPGRVILDGIELLRAAFYRGWVTRGSDEGADPKWDNSGNIERILELRHEAANLVGFDNYAAILGDFHLWRGQGSERSLDAMAEAVLAAQTTFEASLNTTADEMNRITAEARAEEARLLYVAFTRATDRLVVTTAARRVRDHVAMAR